MKMKLFFKICFLLFSLNTFASTNDLELIAYKNAETPLLQIDYTLKIKNNGQQTVKFVKAIDGSFWNFTEPYIEFVAEVNDNGIWRQIKYDRVGRCGNTTDWKESNSILEIKPNEEVEIGHFYIGRNIDGWFRLLEDTKVRLYFIYKMGVEKEEKLELKKLGVAPLTLTSNKIEIDYKNTRSKKTYQEVKQNYLNSAFGEYIGGKYTSTQLLKSMKKIKNTNGRYSEILSEVLGEKPFKFIDKFSCKTKDGYSCVGILYKLDDKIHLGIYAGRHYFFKNKNKDENQSFEYLFGEVTYDQNILNNYLYKN